MSETARYFWAKTDDGEWRIAEYNPERNLMWWAEFEYSGFPPSPGQLGPEILNPDAEAGKA